MIPHVLSYIFMAVAAITIIACFYYIAKERKVPIYLFLTLGGVLIMNAVIALLNSNDKVKGFSSVVFYLLMAYSITFKFRPFVKFRTLIIIVLGLLIAGSVTTTLLHYKSYDNFIWPVLLVVIFVLMVIGHGQVLRKEKQRSISQQEQPKEV